MNVVTFAALDPFAYQEVVRRALAQDIRWGDVTTDGLVSTEQRVVGNLVLRTRCVLAGAAVLRVDGAAGDLVREAVRRSRGHARVAVSGALPHERVAQALAAGADYASLDLSTDAVPRVEVSLELTCATN
ncbi:MAG: hypothetical protein O3A25_05955 [Acidobacteria bacterium]|nr:hypothetical protein [Acidobacteriota bacterium]